MSDLTSQITLKNECFSNEESKLDLHWQNPIHLNTVERKCGEIILLANTKFWFVCTFCDERFHSVIIFRNHIKGVHITDTFNYHEKTNDPLDFQQCETTLIIKPDTCSTEGGDNQPVDDIDMTNNFISKGISDADETIEVDNNIENPDENHSNKIVSKVIENKNIKLEEEIINDCEKKTYTNTKEDCKEIEELNEIPIKIRKKRNRKKKVHTCSLCEHIAVNRQSLERHLRTYHGTGTRFQCEECGKCFGNGGNLKKHLVIHSGARPHKCDACDARFTHSNSLKLHSFLHTGDRPFKCDQCDKGFITGNARKIHMREHTGEMPYACDICTKKFANRCNYIRHKICHTGRRDYVCKKCDKAFKHRETLTKHMACHSSEKKFICEICPSKFTHRKNLVQHIKLHSGIKQYICKVCSKAFAQNAGLYSHMKYHKNKE